MNNLEIYIRAKMSQLRQVNGFGKIVCDMCGESAATQRHHILTRQATMGNVEASQIANSMYTTALLCEPCHSNIDTESNRTRLLLNLYPINGRGNALLGYVIMKSWFDAVNMALRNKLIWELPKPPRTIGDTNGLTIESYTQETDGKSWW